MIIKKYIVKNMNEALTRIRYELGKDAIIISQRRIKSSGITGFFKPKMIEVTAALENDKVEAKSKFANKKSVDLSESLRDIKKLVRETTEVKENFKITSNNSDKYNLDKHSNYIDRSNLENSSKPIGEKNLSESNEKLSDEVKEIKDLLNKVIKNTNKEKEEDVVSEYLRDLDIEETLIKEINSNKEFSLDEFKSNFESIIDSELEISNEELKGKVVLVGPTGVGKTTTIAKLAGRLALIEQKKVALITMDTYRIGAVEQLKTYAEIMDIPFKVVITLKEMEIAVKELEYCDVILIDTTGRSSKNTMQISELRAFNQKVEPDNTILVISGTTKNRDIRTILEGYEKLEYSKIIITKLDETTTYGSLYNIVKIARKPIAYITVGQNVPDDIKIPTKKEVARLILGEDNIC